MTTAPQEPRADATADQGACASVIDRLAELEQKARRSEGLYEGYRRRYEWLNNALGISSTVLAAAASVSVFSQGPADWVSGILAGAAAALAGIQTVLRPERKARFNQEQQFVMARISEEARTLTSQEAVHLSAVELATKRGALQERYFAARETGPS